MGRNEPHNDSKGTIMLLFILLVAAIIALYVAAHVLEHQLSVRYGNHLKTQRSLRIIKNRY